MHICDIFQKDKQTLSFEFFPPRSEEAAEKLYVTISELESYQPSFVSVTYGAGGNTRELTHNLVTRIRRTMDFPPIPHLTCTGHTREEIFDLLVRYAEAGVNNILALKGDPPKGASGYDPSKEAFSHAAELVSFIKEFNAMKIHSDPRGFGIGVAGFPDGHPATPNRLLEMDYLKAKMDAGADYVVTQLMFDNHSFFDFRDRCRLSGIEQPILAGIMPVTTLTGMRRMAELSGGTNFPAALIKALNRAGGEADSIERVGVLYAARQCSELLDESVDGIHFYTLNQSRATREIYKALGLRNGKQLSGLSSSVVKQD